MRDHVTNLELSIKLKEAGFEQESEFYWVNQINEEYQLLDKGITQIRAFTCPENKIYSTYLATELLKWLPEYPIINIYEKPFDYLIICITKLSNGWRVALLNPKYLIGNNSEFHYEAKPTIQDALGEMALYLKKEGLI